MDKKVKVLLLFSFFVVLADFIALTCTYYALTHVDLAYEANKDLAAKFNEFGVAEFIPVAFMVVFCWVAFPTSITFVGFYISSKTKRFYKITKSMFLINLGYLCVLLLIFGLDMVNDILYLVQTVY